MAREKRLSAAHSILTGGFIARCPDSARARYSTSQSSRRMAHMHRSTKAVCRLRASVSRQVDRVCCNARQVLSHSCQLFEKSYLGM